MLLLMLIIMLQCSYLVPPYGTADMVSRVIVLLYTNA